MKKIILKSGHALHQKIILILTFIFTFTIGFLMLLVVVLKIFKVPDFEGDFLAIDYILLLFFPISLFVLLQLLSKKGIFIKDKKIYNVKYIFGKLWFRRKLDLDGITDITILSFKGIQKFSFVSVASPDKGYAVYNNDIYLLNEKHTIKRHLITVDDKDMTEKAIHQINEIFSFNYTAYNPRFNTKRRRR